MPTHDQMCHSFALKWSSWVNEFGILTPIGLTDSRSVKEPADPAVVVCWGEAVGQLSDRAALAFGYILEMKSLVCQDRPLDLSLSVSVHCRDDLKHTHSQQGHISALFPLKSQCSDIYNYFFMKVNEASFCGNDVLFTTRAFHMSPHILLVVSGTLKWDDAQMKKNLTVKTVNATINLLDINFYFTPNRCFIWRTNHMTRLSPLSKWCPHTSSDGGCAWRMR